MRNPTNLFIGSMTLIALSLALVASGGCGSAQETGTVVGGAGGAAAGAAIADEEPVLGALIGGLAGAGAGNLIGAQVDKTNADALDHHQANNAVDESLSSPTTIAEARRADTADINDDGFVTTDEIIALDRAGYSDEEMLSRLRATGQVFDLSVAQEERLLNVGVSPAVVSELESLNREARLRAINAQRDAVSGVR